MWAGGPRWCWRAPCRPRVPGWSTSSRTSRGMWPGRPSSGVYSITSLYCRTYPQYNTLSPASRTSHAWTGRCGSQRCRAPGTSPGCWPWSGACWRAGPRCSASWTPTHPGQVRVRSSSSSNEKVPTSAFTAKDLLRRYYKLAFIHDLIFYSPPNIAVKFR